MSDNSQARDLFQQAYENRYTWDENFPGYAADLTISQGDEVYTAQIQVTEDLKVEVLGIADEQVRESAYNQLRDVVTHRKRANFAAAHGQNQFFLGDVDAAGSQAIKVEGDAMGSNYRVRGQEITQVSRVMGPMAFTINTEASQKTESGYISTKYNAIFRDAKTGDLRGKREFAEVYEKVGDYYLPSKQVIRSIDQAQEPIVTEFAFSNLRLLEPALEPR